MDKLGVVFEEETIKTAAQKKVPSCPKCGEEKVEYNQLLFWCPNCGTEPFEKRPELK